MSTENNEDDTDRIAQFMWGYQPHFRIAVETRIESALREIGFEGNPEVLLVGLEATGEHYFSICIEPEQGPFSPADLEGVSGRGTALYEQHPDHDIFHTDPGLHEARHAALRDEMRAEAIAEALAATMAGQGRSFFAGQSVRVDDYNVHVVISVDSEGLTKVSTLTSTIRDRMPVIPSLVHAVIREVLARARRALYLPDARGDLEGQIPEIVRSAAARLVQSALLCAGYWFGSGTDRILSAVSSLPYEGRSGSGRLILAKANHSAIDVRLKLRDIVDLDDSRAIRKLIEASGVEGDLLSDGEHVYGVGLATPDYDPSSETVFVVTVVDRGTWELSHDGSPLLTVRDGNPRLPSRPLDVAYFQDIVERLLPGSDQATLVELAEAAGHNEHGAMLIMSSDAAAEAERLAPQAWVVVPVPLAPELLIQLTGMDGGVLVDPQGNCHAIGVILDGRACGNETPARGSRFNNAVRYLQSGPPPAVVVVYSTDGTIDVLPQLRPRLKRSSVQRAVQEYLALATPPPGKYGLSNAWDAVKRLRFYLSEEQCNQVNAARASLDKWRDDRGHIRIVEQGLTPRPKMNDSYWLAEES